MLDKGAGLPKEMISKSEKRILDFKSLKSEIDSDLLSIVQTLISLRQKIRINKHDKMNINGLLTQNVEDYLLCLELDHKKLEDLFNKD